MALWGITNPAVGDIINTCAPILSVPVSSGPYVVQTDYWNTGSCPGTQCMTINSNTGAFSVNQGPVCNNSTVGSYPDILYGCAFGNCSAGSPLPAPIRTLSCVTSDWNFTTTNTGLWDVAYDIWFCPDNTCGSGGFNGGAELMIWPDYTDSGWQYDLGAVTNSGMSWELWEWPVASAGMTWTYLAYLSKTPVTSVSNLDIKGFIGDAVSRGYIQPSWYLYAVEAGIEIRNGGVPFINNSFSVSVNACATATATPTSTPIEISSPTITPTETVNPSPTGKDVEISSPYPNPAQGTGPVNFDIEAPTGSAINWNIFTTTSRKIMSGSRIVFGDTTLTWNQTDKNGIQVANGLYYLQVKVTSGETSLTKILKVLILR